MSTITYRAVHTDTREPVVKGESIRSFRGTPWVFEFCRKVDPNKEGFVYVHRFVNGRKESREMYPSVFKLVIEPVE